MMDCFGLNCSSLAMREEIIAKRQNQTVVNNLLVLQCVVNAGIFHDWLSSDRNFQWHSAAILSVKKISA